MRHLFTVAVISLAALLQGCQHYAYVESQVKLDAVNVEPSVTKTALYPKLRKTTKTVAFVAPASCRDVKQADLIRSHCGVSMGSAEELMTKNDFNVVSWEMLDRKGVGTSHLEVAKSLNVDVLFTLNSLEAMDVTKNRELTRTFYRSNDGGAKLQAWQLGESHQATIRAILKPIEDNFLKRFAGAKIDVTAIDVKSGQSFWYYKASFYDARGQDATLATVFKGKKANWELFRLDGKPLIKGDPNIEVTRGNTGSDADQSTREVAIKAFIDAFKSGL